MAVRTEHQPTRSERPRRTAAEVPSAVVREAFRRFRPVASRARDDQALVRTVRKRLRMNG